MAEHSHAHAGTHPDAHDLEHIKKHVRVYIAIFIALLVGTVVTVLASFVDFGSPTRNIVIAMIIASIKAFLVAGYFMHLFSEKKMIYGILIVTVFFFIGLMYLTIWSMEPKNLVHYKQAPVEQRK